MFSINIRLDILIIYSFSEYITINDNRFPILFFNNILWENVKFCIFISSKRSD